MKVIIVALALVAVVAAVPVETESPKIIRSEFVQKPEGGYGFSYETENGVSRTETGELKEVLNEDNKPQPVVVVRGSYSYTDNDGHVESVSYVADETGYHAEGDSIPKLATR